MIPADQIEADRLYDMLADAYEPKTDYEEESLHEVARERTLLKRCQTNLFALTELEMNAAESDWDEDQAAAAAELALRMPKAPGLVRVQLSQTPHGAALEEDRWTRLGVAIDRAGVWTEAQRHMALDLLGVPMELREKGQTEVDAQPGQDPRVVARAVVEAQLRALRDPRAVARRQDRDDRHRLMALRGNPPLISKEKRLMERYGNMHARRADKAMAEFERLRTARLKGEESASPSRPAARTPAEDLQQYMRDAQAESEARVAETLALWKARQAAAGSSPGASTKSAHAAHHAYPQRDREAEQARRKAEYDARKQQKQQNKQR
jgi:hypothetical protein